MLELVVVAGANGFEEEVLLSDWLNRGEVVELVAEAPKMFPVDENDDPNAGFGAVVSGVAVEEPPNANILVEPLVVAAGNMLVAGLVSFPATDDDDDDDVLGKIGFDAS